MRNNSVKKNIFLALLVSIGLAVGYIENMIPMPIPLPGARLGLSNIVVVVTIVVFGRREGFVVALLKSVLLMLVTGNVSSFFYSFAGAFLSAIAMNIAWYGLKLSIISTSLIGSFFHNLAQVTVASLMVSNIRLFYYFPFLIILGIFTGIFVGMASKVVVEQLRKSIPEIGDKIE